MRLTRRDALAALASAGVAGVAGCAAPDAEGERLDPAATSTLVAAAAVLYPSGVENVEGFVRTYATGRTRDDPERRAGIEAATAELDGVARDWYDEGFATMSVERREATLREAGADTADADPDGALANRLRFYVVNELLYALYTSPAGGRLAGVENPVGHPGGTTSYQQGPR